MSESIKCIHCGEDCGKYPIVWQDKNFCCEGCKTVYQLLNDNKLTGYYDIYSNPGVKVEVNDFGKKYAYLDNEEIANKLIYFTEGEYSKVKLYIPDIHCSSCIWLLENLYQIDSNITQSSVNFIKKEADITFINTKISLRKVVELLASIHYIPMISLEDIDDKKNSTENKTLIIKIGIAGFVFGNTMLLSLPDYIPGGELLDDSFKHFFGYINLFLSLPIILYCGNDYIISAYKNLKHKMINIDLPISIGMLAIFGESAYQILSSTGTGYMDSLAGLVFFLLLGKWYQNKTYQALSFERDYKSYFPVAVSKIVDEEEEIIPINNIKVGDKIIVHNQELIPADGILINGDASINYSFVTGESKPVVKKSGDELYAGGKQIGSTIIIEITKEVMQSKLTQLWNQENSNTSEKSLTTLIDKISKSFTIVILSMATFAGAYWLWNDSTLALMAFTSVLIVACPCALALSIPFTYGNIMQSFGRLGFYLKKSTVVEQLSKVDTVVFDKTGTITHIDSESVKYYGRELSNEELSQVKALTRQSQHPLSKSIFNSITTAIDLSLSNFMEIASSGIKCSFNDTHLKMGSSSFVNIETKNESQFASNVHISINDEVIGYYSIENSYRDGIETLADKLNKNYEIHIISGDNDAEAKRLKDIFGDNTNLLFNQSPMDKYNYIKNLKDEGKYVLMVGDGLNDAGALKESNIGISIADDVFNFSPASDAILEAKNFNLLPAIFEKSKKSINIVYASFGMSFLYNVVGLSYAVSGQLSPIIAAILMPLSSISVVAFVTLGARFLMRKMK
ncbi:MAG: heavy metal translocating P-type ATPase metal-binding domain-containing protein [Bacteroidales bacterium]|nr:heavy metal translocating P-type ATPase metal-binding domain-containing protein [Bacteroidales bacterium]